MRCRHQENPTNDPNTNQDKPKNDEHDDIDDCLYIGEHPKHKDNEENKKTGKKEEAKNKSKNVSKTNPNKDDDKSKKTHKKGKKEPK